jgi:hypothetical protein
MVQIWLEITEGKFGHFGQNWAKSSTTLEKKNHGQGVYFFHQVKIVFLKLELTCNDRSEPDF